MPNLDKSKTVDSKSMLQTIKTNSVNSASHSPTWFITFITPAKTAGDVELSHMLTKYGKTFDTPVYNL